VDTLRETFVIWDAEWRRTVRSGRAVVLLGLYGLFSLLVLLALGALISAAREQLQEQLAGASAADMARVAEEMQKGFLGFLVNRDEAMVESLSRVPLVVLLVFKLTLFFLPVYVALMGFDQVSGEVGPRSIRYLTVRARRTSLLLGKFFSQATVLLALVLLVDLAIFLYATLTTPGVDYGLMALNLLKFWVAAVVFSLAYLSLTALCSSLFRTPALSLVFNFALLFVFWLMDVIGGAAAEGNPLRYVRYLSPSNYSQNLLHPQLVQFGSSTLAYLAFAAIFLGGAHLILRWRDL
jgi:ABC-2 type transport system permease protein